MTCQSLILRIPFTLILTIGIAVAGFMTEAWKTRVPPSLIENWGFAPSYLWNGNPLTYVTAAFLTDRPFMFWGILVFAPLVVGAFETAAGTYKTFLRFWIGGLAALLCVAFVGLIFGLIEPTTSAQFIYVPDVGMSAGGFTCLGGLIALQKDHHLKLIATVFSFIFIKMLFQIELSSDFTHMFALLIGFNWQRWHL